MAQLWQDYAILQASSGGKEWRVQINSEGRFRCNCPSFIFCKGSKQCKHTRLCEQQQRQEAAMVAPVAAVSAVPASMTEALALFDSMCGAAKTSTGLNVKAFCGPDGSRAMVDVLAAKLAAWVPPAAIPPSLVTSHTATGVRRISFDD